MKVTLTLCDGTQRVVEQPRAHQGGVTASGACPGCARTPFVVGGCGEEIESWDTYRAQAACLACRQRVGVLRVQVSTLFGIEEDERVLRGPWKVY